jgi:hypothetical protein
VRFSLVVFCIEFEFEYVWWGKMLLPQIPLSQKEGRKYMPPNRLLCVVRMNDLLLPQLVTVVTNYVVS